MRAAIARPAIAVLLVCGVASACVHPERKEMVEAREKYRACVDEGPGAEERCAALEADMLVKQERYEKAGERAWRCKDRVSGCDPTGRGRY